MKKLLYALRNYKSFALLGALVFGVSLSYAEKFQVIKLKGNSFSVSKKGKTRSLKAGEYIYFGDEILVEESSEVGLLGPGELFLHLSGGAHIKLSYDSYKLLKGSVWLQKKRRTGSLNIETTNALVTFFEGDSIIQYLDGEEKTDVFVLSGKAIASNLFDKYKNVSLSDGEFSFIKKEHNEGRPRLATLIGKDSFVKLRSQFANVSPLEKGGVTELYRPRKDQPEDLKDLNREIASLDSAKIEETSRKLPLRTKHRSQNIKSEELSPSKSSDLGFTLITEKMKSNWKVTGEKVKGRVPSSITPPSDPVSPKKVKKVEKNVKINIYGMKNTSSARLYKKESIKVRAIAPVIESTNRFPASSERESFGSEEPGIDGLLQRLNSVEESRTESY